MVHTGLRISDVVLFDMERLRGNGVFLRAKKNGGDVLTHIPDWYVTGCCRSQRQTAGSRS